MSPSAPLTILHGRISLFLSGRFSSLTRSLCISVRVSGTTGEVRARVVGGVLAAVRRVSTGELVRAALQSQHFPPYSPLGPAHWLEPLAKVRLRERGVYDGQGIELARNEHNK